MNAFIYGFLDEMSKLAAKAPKVPKVPSTPAPAKSGGLAESFRSALPYMLMGGLGGRSEAAEPRQKKIGFFESLG